MSPSSFARISNTEPNFTENSLIQAKTHVGLIFPSESALKIKIDNNIPTDKNFPDVLCS